MKPIELGSTSTAGAELVPDFGTGSIHVARRPRQGAAGLTGPPAMAQPPALTFVVPEARPTRIRARIGVVLAVVVAAFLWVLIESGSNGGPSRSPRASVRLSPVQQRAAAAERVRAAAIAQAKRDRGTDAELQDTIPALTPPPG